MTLTAVSLFAGIGGFDVALERNGVDVKAAVEIDPHARSVLARHFPDTVLFDDVTKVTGDELRATGFVADRGIVTAGFPCQDVSVAGRRAGLAGERTGLWWHVVRLLAELNPRWFLGENVPGLLSSNGGQDFGAVLGSLGELGYGFAYRVLDAQHFGVPQQRRRVFIVGHLGAPFGAAAQVLLEPESSDGDSPQGSETREAVAANASGGARHASGGGLVPTVSSKWSKGSGGPAGDECQNLIIDTHTHTHTQGLRRCREAGNGDTGSTPNQQRADTSSSRNVVAALTSNGVGTCGADDNQAQAGHVVVTPLAVRGREGGADLELGTEGGPYNCLRAGDGGSSRSSRSSLIAITSLAVAGDFSSSEDVAQTIRSASGQPGVVAIHENQRGELSLSDTTTGGGKPGQGYPCIQDETTVRRLTELECERLQGFPDEWTANQSGAARYRQLGNAVAVPVAEWIVNRLVAVDGMTHE